MDRTTTRHIAHMNFSLGTRSLLWMKISNLDENLHHIKNNMCEPKMVPACVLNSLKSLEVMF